MRRLWDGLRAFGDRLLRTHLDDYLCKPGNDLSGDERDE